jgi:hypothetical protein
VRRCACTRPSSETFRPGSTTRARRSRASSTRPASAAASRRSSASAGRLSPVAPVGRRSKRVVVGGRGRTTPCQSRRGGIAPTVRLATDEAGGSAALAAPRRLMKGTLDDAHGGAPAGRGSRSGPGGEPPPRRAGLPRLPTALGADIALFPRCGTSGTPSRMTTAASHPTSPRQARARSLAYSQCSRHLARRRLGHALPPPRRRDGHGDRRLVSGAVVRGAAKQRDPHRSPRRGRSDLRQGPHLRLRRTRGLPHARGRIPRGRPRHRRRPGPRRSDDLLRPRVPRDRAHPRPRRRRARPGTERMPDGGEPTGQLRARA